MMKASPCTMLPPKASMTAAVQAGKAPIWSGNTTRWATTSPPAVINAEDASCDPRTMVEKPVRNREFCISCTMPERLAFTTSRSMASTARMGSAFLRHDQALPFVHPRGLAGTHDGRAIELLEDRRPCKGRSYVELLSLIDGTVEFRAVKARAPRASPRILECSAAAFEFRRLDRPHEADTAHAIGDDLDRLLRRHVAEHALMLLIEADAQLFELAHPQRFGSAGDGDLVALTGVAHVE